MNNSPAHDASGNDSPESGSPNLGAPATDRISASDVLRRLEGSGPMALSVALVVAHPDDESIALGGTFARIRRLTMIHATDGAPRSFQPSNRFATREDALRTRVAETDGALQAALANPVRRLRYEFTDGDVVDSLQPFIDRLAADLMFCDAVITHAFEGGHIDHDGCSLAVQYACVRLQRLVGWAPARLEFAGYYAQRGKVRAAQFSPRPDCEEIRLTLSPSARRRREMAFACHRSQEDNLRFFNVARECFRKAPLYDFSHKPSNPLYSEGEQARFAERLCDLGAASDV